MNILAHGAVLRANAWPTIAAVVTCCAIGAMYGKGLQDLWLRRGAGSVVSAPRAAAFAAGLATLIIATSAPVDRLAEESFAGHMTQHMAMLMVAGPLLGLGGGALPFTLALPHPARRGLSRWRASGPVRWLRRPVQRALAGGLVFTGVLWIWHFPAMYALAERNDAVHAVEHACYVLVAWALWAAVLTPGKHRLAGPLGFLLLFTVGMAGAALGAVLTFAPVPLYPPDMFPAGDALTDQQLAGLVMWIPMDVVVMGVALSIFGRWLAALDSRHPGGQSIPSDATCAEVMSR
jgi:cytochrome c oxidase assembly factor CtaG